MCRPPGNTVCVWKLYLYYQVIIIHTQLPHMISDKLHKGLIIYNKTEFGGNEANA